VKLKIVTVKIGDERVELAIPEEDEVIGIVEQALGWAHYRVKCFDGVERICRVPRPRRWTKDKFRFNVAEGNYVLVKPWPNSKDKGDIIYKYDRKQVEALKKLGYLEEEF